MKDILAFIIHGLLNLWYGIGLVILLRRPLDICDLKQKLNQIRMGNKEKFCDWSFDKGLKKLKDIKVIQEIPMMS